jgi:hypothetical protein
MAAGLKFGPGGRGKPLPYDDEHYDKAGRGKPRPYIVLVNDD